MMITNPSTPVKPSNLMTKPKAERILVEHEVLFVPPEGLAQPKLKTGHRGVKVTLAIGYPTGIYPSKTRIYLDGLQKSQVVPGNDPWQSLLLAIKQLQFHVWCLHEQGWRMEWYSDESITNAEGALPMLLDELFSDLLDSKWAGRINGDDAQ